MNAGEGQSINGINHILIDDDKFKVYIWLNESVMQYIPTHLFVMPLFVIEYEIVTRVVACSNRLKERND